MRPILVTGGTGTLGRLLVARLTGSGRTVHILSRGPRPATSDLTWHTADLNSGAGLTAALDGGPVVVHCASDTSHNGKSDLVATRHLLRAAAEAGSPHFVYISIVGVDRHPLPYYRRKLAVEQLIETGDVPWTILRTTQVHELIEKMIGKTARLPVMPVLSHISCQPIAAAEVAERLAELAVAAPAGRVADMGGPEVLTARELAKSYLAAGGKRRPVVPVRIPGRVGQAFRGGLHLAPDHAVGRQTWAEHLALSSVGTE